MKAPRLDDRSWETLRDALIRRIPLHTPEWTDHNIGDPGVTLVELFAQLSKGLMDRVNAVPRSAHAEFLRLLNLEPDSASPATGWVQFDTDVAAGLVVEFGSVAPKTYVASGAIEYRIEHEVPIHAVEVRSYIKKHEEFEFAEDDLELARQALSEALGRAVDTAELNPYRSVELGKIERGTVPAGKALHATVDQVLWIAVAAKNEAEIEVVRDALRDGRLSLGVGIDAPRCGIDGQVACGAEVLHDDTKWQISTAGFSGATEPANAAWVNLGVSDDTTDSLRKTGRVMLDLPSVADRWHFDDEDTTPGTIPGELRGVGAFPPAVEDAAFEEKIVAWIRAFRTSDVHPVVTYVVPNVAEVAQRVTIARERLGAGRGTPYQVFQLGHTPVLADSLVVQVQLNGVDWVTADRVDDLTFSGRDHLHFTLDPASGILRFGDGLNGRMPQVGESIRALSYQTSLGSQGNVGAGAITRVSRNAPSQTIRVFNPLAMSAGRDAATIIDLQRLAPAALRNRDRCVAAQDFIDIALRTPTRRVGRAEVIPRFRPFERAFEIPGAVTVVVLPEYDPEYPDEPTPDADFLAEVCAWLEPRRLVTTEVYVIPPEYLGVRATIAIEINPGEGELTVRNWVEMAIRQMLAPLPPYGPAGDGWPLGRPIREADIAAAALRVAGVQLVRDVKLFTEDGTRSPTVVLQPWELPVVRSVEAIVGSVAPEPQIVEAPPGAGVVTVPVYREEC